MLFYCWADVEDGGPTINVNVSCLLGMYIGCMDAQLYYTLTRRSRYLSIIMTYCRPLKNPERFYNDVMYNVSLLSS